VALFLISVENESHCDFVKLREMLIRTNMEDMREKTHMRHYELYRKKRLEQVTYYCVTWCFSDRASWIDYILITNLMHWLLFIH